MKRKWHIFIISFICVLSLGSICCLPTALLTTPGNVSKVIKPSTTAGISSTQGISRSIPPLSRLRWSRSVHSYKFVTPTLLSVDPKARIQADLAYAPDVSVDCSPSDFEVRVKPGFYGLGADAQELTLGGDCRSNGVIRPHGDLLFTYPLTACGAVRELPHGYLVYKHVLHYEPSPKRFPSRAHQIDVNIECHYGRDHSVYQLAVQPTWQTVVLRKELKGRAMDFQMDLMDDSWRTPAKSQVYLLGKAVNIQVSAPHLPPGLKLYINSCYAAPSGGSESSLKYTIIDNFGCLLDSKHEPGSSQFVSRTDKTLRFSLRTFQFTAEPDIGVGIHCKLSVTSEGPGPAQKSCTYQDQRWRALTGHNSICECCESTCVASTPQRALLEGFVISRPLMVSDQPHSADNGYQQKSPSTVSRSKDELHYEDLNDNKKLWEGAAGEKQHSDEEDEWLEESEIIHGALMEPELKELPYSGRVLEPKWSEPKLSDLNEFGESASGFEQDDISEHAKSEDAFEAREDAISEVPTVPVNDKKEDPRGQLEVFEELSLEGRLKPPNPKEGKVKKHVCKGDKDRKMMPPKIQRRNQDVDVNEKEQTWYFTWT